LEARDHKVNVDANKGREGKSWRQEREWRKGLTKIWGNRGRDVGKKDHGGRG